MVGHYLLLTKLFKKVQGGEISCGRGIDLHNYDDSPLASTSVSNKPSLKSELMPTPLKFTLASLKGHLPIYIEFECVLKEDETDDLSTNDNTPQQQASVRHYNKCFNEKMRPLCFI